MKAPNGRQADNPIACQIVRHWSLLLATRMDTTTADVSVANSL